MNNKIENIKNTYTVGMRVELVSMDDAQAPPSGTQGTISFVDDIGNIHVNWDNGSSLALNIDCDFFMVLE